LLFFKIVFFMLVFRTGPRKWIVRKRQTTSRAEYSNVVASCLYRSTKAKSDRCGICVQPSKRNCRNCGKIFEIEYACRYVITLTEGILIPLFVIQKI
jgi:hypothetical protein